MATKYQKQPPISLMKQRIDLKKKYSDLIESISIQSSQLKCVMHLKPSEETDLYRIRITYKLTDFAPKVWLIEPELRKFDGKNPHHIYEFDKNNKPRLCVYYPGYSEWNRNMFIADTLVPWTITWLNTYEYWLITGKWNYYESPRKKASRTR